jgi:hypothetical protein
MGNFLNPLPLPIAKYIKAPPACEQSIHSNPKLRNRNDKDTHACLPLEELVAATIYLKLFSVFVEWRSENKFTVKQIVKVEHGSQG